MKESTKKALEELLPQHRLFVQGYLEHYNASKAYREAGYKDTDAAGVSAHHLLKKPKIQAIIRTLEREELEEWDQHGRRVIREYIRIAFADIGDAFDEDGRLKNIKDMSPEMRAVLSEVTIDVSNVDLGDDERITVTTSKIKRWDKLRALEKLAQRMELWGDDQEREFTVNMRLEDERTQSKEQANGNGHAPEVEAE